MDDGNAFFLLRNRCTHRRDVRVHLCNEFIALCLFARERRKGADLAFHVLIALHIDDERLDAVRRERLNELFIHALVEDDEIGREGEHFLGVDLVNPADACSILRRLRNLRLRVGAADHLPADRVQRLEEGRGCDDDALRLLVKADRAPIVVRDGGIGALRGVLRCGRAAGGEHEGRCHE